MSNNVSEHDLSVDTPQRKSPSLPLLAAIFIGTMIVAGGIIFALLNALLPEDDTITSEFGDLIVQEARTDGVRVIDPPREVTDFTLTSHTGDPLSISDLRGRYVLMYFGYTNCPDICPMTLLDVRDVYEGLGVDAENVAFAFISVDGERDTPAALANFIERRRMGDYLIGLSGEETVLRQITPDYNLQYELDSPDENGYYAVDHTTTLFLLDPEGRLMRLFGFGTSPDTIISEIQDAM